MRSTSAAMLVALACVTAWLVVQRVWAREIARTTAVVTFAAADAPEHPARAIDGPAARAAAPAERPCDLDDERDVPLLRLRGCPPGRVGQQCDERFDIMLSQLPEPARWRAEFADARVARCQQQALDETYAALAGAHADDFHVSGRGSRRVENIYVINDRKHPCTVGKMLHQFAVANHAALTNPARAVAGLPAQMRWQVRDDPDWHYTRNGTICPGRRAGWFCLWERFPPKPPPPATARPPAAVWPPGAVGPDSPLQYVLMGVVMRALTRPTDALLEYLRPRIRVRCADGRPAEMGTIPPRCPGRTGPSAAVQVRHGDSCEGSQQRTKGPRNMMIRGGKRLFRYCYTWDVYARELEMLRERYGLQTVYLATDDPAIVREAVSNTTSFDWVTVDWPREQLAKPKPWVEFRQNLDEHVPLSLAAELEVLSHADMFVGSFGSQVGRSIYFGMNARTRTGSLPPFVSVDGYGLCCDFREDCTEEDILARGRPMRECIEKGGAEAFLRQFPVGAAGQQV